LIAATGSSAGLHRHHHLTGTRVWDVDPDDLDRRSLAARDDTLYLVHPTSRL
jgi:hypothetical protein